MQQFLLHYNLREFYVCSLRFVFIYVALVVFDVLQLALVVVIGGAVVWCYCACAAGSAPPALVCRRRRARRRPRCRPPCRPAPACCHQARDPRGSAHSRTDSEKESQDPFTGSESFFCTRLNDSSLQDWRQLKILCVGPIILLDLALTLNEQAWLSNYIF